MVSGFLRRMYSSWLPTHNSSICGKKKKCTEFTKEQGKRQKDLQNWYITEFFVFKIDTLLKNRKERFTNLQIWYITEEKTTKGKV
jgi:hypothetical protein